MAKTPAWQKHPTKKTPLISNPTTMITLPNKDYTSNIPLQTILSVMTKVEMLDICKKLDLYVSPNQRKEETARRVAQALLDSPVSIASALCKTELQLLDELVKAGANAYVVRKIRKQPYKLQKFGLVLTYIDNENKQWHLLMPDEVRESLTETYPLYLQMAEAGKKGPTPKELRMMEMLNWLYGGGNDEE
jgi:hypothetical protein